MPSTVERARVGRTAGPKGGHGFWRPFAKLIDDEVDRYAFLVKNLDFTPSLGGQ